MGWKGTVRAIETEIRRAAREAERERKHDAKMQALDDAESTVIAFEDYIDQITSIHEECISEKVDWNELVKISPPIEPDLSNGNESAAKHKYDHFKPNFIHKLFKQMDKKKATLQQAISVAKNADKQEYKANLRDYHHEHSEWEKRNTLAKRLLEKDEQAHVEVIKHFNPFSNIEDLGSGIVFTVSDVGNVIANINVHSDEVIPKEKYSLRQSGTLSTKNMPKFL